MGSRYVRSINFAFENLNPLRDGKYTFSSRIFQSSGLGFHLEGDGVSPVYRYPLVRSRGLVHGNVY